MGDHVNMMISIPSKYSVAQVAGFIKGKSAIHIAKAYAGRKRNYTGQSFWAEVIMSLQLDAMKMLCVSTSKIRKRET